MNTVQEETGEVVLEAIATAHPQVYDKAVAAAGGDTLSGIRARRVKAAMTLWCPDTDEWLVVAARPTTESKPGGLIYGRSMDMTDIPIRPEPGQSSRSWEIRADTPLIRRHLRSAPTGRSGP